MDLGAIAIRQYSSISGASSLDCLVSKQDIVEMHLVYLAAPADWAMVHKIFFVLFWNTVISNANIYKTDIFDR